ncbi:hypothetical protein BVC80_1837g48 [Macleaya cordata]|uniref:HMG box domain-containing protein n=1 Tax=Macleaya cordata TaxID=56857 RepID=A0A200R3G4_MACCD|nr:hypothetical protein BVC80_1837g48 [Macleaya cordata]
MALYDMHDCKLKGRNKRLKCKSLKTETLKCEDGKRTLENPSFSDQPRSAFCIFMEIFKKATTTEDQISVDRKGFETWKSMSVEERLSFFLEAEKVNSSYEQALLEEVEVESEVDDEADSANVGRFSLIYEEYDDWENSESFEIPL